MELATTITAIQDLLPTIITLSVVGLIFGKVKSF